MKISFFKFHGNGNDFIIIDALNSIVHINELEIRNLCNRRFGIGSDGLIIISESTNNDFEMQYFNSDGREGTMCGNGGRCASSYWFSINPAKKIVNFNAIDGLHSAELINKIENEWNVRLKMNDVNEILNINDGYYLNTGSPHFVKFVSDVNKVNVEVEGAKIRNNKDLFPDGTNVDFVSIKDNLINIRTFERGVEAETLSCGTGVIAAAIVTQYSKKILSNNVVIKALGGSFVVDAESEGGDKFVNIYLQGPAKFVFSGTIQICDIC